MKKIIFSLIGIIFLSGLLYSIPSHPSQVPAGYNWRIDSPWTAIDDQTASWHSNSGRVDPTCGCLDWANYECYGQGSECRDSDWLTVWRAGVTPPAPGISGYYSSTNYPSFPPYYNSTLGVYHY